jgi:Zn-dependent protease with chaperone function
MLRDFRQLHSLWIGLCCLGFLTGPQVSSGQAPDTAAANPPSSEQIAGLLEQEPFTVRTWPTWRQRLLDWIEDRSESTTPAYRAGREFMKSQAGPSGKLAPPLAGDAFAWYLLGGAFLRDADEDKTRASALYAKAEGAVRQSLALNGKFARAHVVLAAVLMRSANPQQAAGAQAAADPRLVEASKELQTARRLDPKLFILPGQEGELALRQNRPAQAEQSFRVALREDPRPEYAIDVAWAVILNNDIQGDRAKRIEDLLQQFPDSGQLACFNAVCLAQDGRVYAAGRELRRARRLGADPAALLPGQVAQQIEQEAGTWLLLGDFGWLMLALTAFYALVMALMALFGYALALRTRGTRALSLFSKEPTELVSGGRVLHTQTESILARMYTFSLFVGLILFYFAIPFVLAGLLAATGLILYGIFLLPRIPVKLLVIVAVVGLGMAWAVLKSIFSRPKQGGFGLPKTRAQCPRLYDLLQGVAERVDTRPVDEVFLAPGSSIGVHQEGRGPFGIFGVNRRILTLGMSTLHFLTLSELQAILAHEYAHFSHRDTFYNRFIYQVQLSIGQALQGMGQSGGAINYVNPFFWFLYLYYKAYNLLSAGFSRSREFLADRMASCLYGSDVFATALTKVSTDGTLFEMTIYNNISKLLAENKSFVNMYSAFQSFRDEQLSEQDRDELYRKLLEEKESLFASHPTFQERIAAIAELPRAVNPDDSSALQLFDQPEEMEKELTEFLTGYMHHVHHVQAQASAGSNG